MYSQSVLIGKCIVANFDIKNLKALKKELKKQKKAEQEQTRLRKKEQIIEQQEQSLFTDAMQGVTPHTHDKVHHEVPKPNAKRHIPNDETDEGFDFHDPLSDELEVDEVDSEEMLSFCRDGIQKNVFKKLRSGQYRISDELDLHGATIKQAKQLLVYYLQEAVQFEGCCIRIIHGKGHRSNKNKPILKKQVNHWLREHERVLAFHSAKIKDGGSGAVYVLLKRQ